MNRKYLVVSLGFLIASSLLWAKPQNLFSLSQTEWMNLLNGQNLTRSVIWENSVAELAPLGSIAQEKTKEAEARAKGISVASLALVPYPKNWETQSEEQQKLELYNLLHRVSTLQGLTYGDEKKKVLFSESYTIKNPEDKKSKVEDPVAQALPSIDITYVCQEDSIFGKNIYQHTYQVSQDEVFVDITNLTTMKFLGISFVKPKDMALYLSATKTQEGILLYASTTLATTEPKVSFLFWSFNLADESMNRIIAYQDWFRTQV